MNLMMFFWMLRQILFLRYDSSYFAAFGSMWVRVNPYFFVNVVEVAFFGLSLMTLGIY
jgi:hypothetical protein